MIAKVVRNHDSDNWNCQMSLSMIAAIREIFKYRCHGQRQLGFLNAIVGDNDN